MSAPVAVSLLADVSAVMAPSEAELWSETICARLAELRPEIYGGLDPTGLASALAAYDVGTKQVWGKTADDKKANRRGVVRADVLTALAASGSPLDPSGTASGPAPAPTSKNTPGAASSGLLMIALPLGYPRGLTALTAASASGGIGVLGWLAGLGAALVLFTAYYWLCRLFPYGACFGCLGHPGRNKGGRHWGTCKRCHGTGKRIRLGTRILRNYREGS